MFRLDQILGKSGSKDKDVYESKVSLSSRIVKVERQVSEYDNERVNKRYIKPNTRRITKYVNIMFRNVKTKLFSRA